MRLSFPLAVRKVLHEADGFSCTPVDEVNPSGRLVFEDMMARCHAYLDAGADCVYPIHLEQGRMVQGFGISVFSNVRRVWFCMLVPLVSCPIPKRGCVPLDRIAAAPPLSA